MNEELPTQSSDASFASSYPAGETSGGNEPPSDGVGEGGAGGVANEGVRFVPSAHNERDGNRVAVGAGGVTSKVGTRKARASSQHKKHRPAKSVALSTLLCEGYNIEQRNCNSFECSGELIHQLSLNSILPKLRFKKKLNKVLSIHKIRISTFFEKKRS